MNKTIAILAFIILLMYQCLGSRSFETLYVVRYVVKIDCDGITFVKLYRLDTNLVKFADRSRGLFWGSHGSSSALVQHSIDASFLVRLIDLLHDDLLEIHRVRLL